MIRYTRQVLKNSCGPIAIINAMKWAGYMVPRAKWVKGIGGLCEFSPKAGTSLQGMASAIKLLHQLELVEYKTRPTLKWLDQKFHEGCGIILKYEHRHKPSGHFVFLPGRTRHYYEVVNKGKKAHARIHRKTMSKLLAEKGQRNVLVYSCAWAVKPVEPK